MDVEHFHTYGEKKLILANMDETPLYFDMRRNSTYTFRGDRSVPIIRTNGHRKRITVCLAILSDGRKLPPFVIFKRKSCPSNPYGRRMLLSANANGWITEALMLRWMSCIWGNMKLNKDEMKMLILDKCTSHIKPSVIKAAKEDHNFIDFIPAGCTSLVQPLDLMINKPFKDGIRAMYERWMQEDGLKPSNKTKCGYYKAPDYKLMLKWIDEVWNSIDPELIKRSFKYAGIASHQIITYAILGLTTNYLGGDEHLMKAELQEGALGVKKHVESLLNQEAFRQIDAEISDWNVDDATRVTEATTYDISSESDNQQNPSPASVLNDNYQVELKVEDASDTSSDDNENPFLDYSDDDSSSSDEGDNKHKENNHNVLNELEISDGRYDGYIDFLEPLDRVNDQIGTRKKVSMVTQTETSGKKKDGKIQVKLDQFKFVKK